MIVTGASGLLGPPVCIAARDAFDVLALYGRRRFSLAGVRTQPSDLLDSSSLYRLLRAERPHVIVHLAAATNVDQCEVNPEETTTLNVNVTRELADWAKAHTCKLVFFSTDSVFDGRRGNYKESDPPGPLNLYAKTKVRAEEVVRTGGQHLILRGAFYGWNMQSKRSLAEWIISELGADRVINGYTDTIFSPLYCGTLARIILALIERDASGTYHVGSCDYVSKFEFAKMLAERFGYCSRRVRPARLDDSVGRAVRPLNTSLCTDKIRSEFSLRLPLVGDDLDEFKKHHDDRFAAYLKTLCN